jgi:pyridoxine/pyridoxamine 5'-phosphate oxidase
MDADEAALLAFARRHPLAVVATVSSDGAPDAAVVGIAVSGDFEIVFDTLETTRKAINLRTSRRAAVVIGWDDDCTLQIDGIADEPRDDERERIKAIYFGKYPEGRERQSWPGITWFRVRPAVLRYSDFRARPPTLLTVRRNKA